MYPQSLKFTLNNGVQLPAVGLGTYQGQNGTDDPEHLEYTIVQAIEIGYRHFDTAFSYLTEVNVGNAIKRSSVPRSELFIVTKLHGIHHACVAEAFELSLKNLQLEYIDLYLMHWPQPMDEDENLTDGPSPLETWLQMEKLLETGKCRAIGVSNFSEMMLKPILQHGKVVPAVNQIEVHPYLPQFEMVDICEKNGIHVTSWCSLGGHRPRMIKIHDDPIITSIAAKRSVTNSQLVLSWIVQRGISVIPQSSKVARINENIKLIKLHDEEMKVLNELHKMDGRSYRIGGPVQISEDGTPIIHGWTYKQLGWE